MSKTKLQKTMSFCERRIILSLKYWSSMEAGAWSKIEAEGKHFELNQETPFYRGHVQQAKDDLRVIQETMIALGLTIDSESLG